MLERNKPELIREIMCLRKVLHNARRAMICSVTGISDGITIHQIRDWIADADALLGPIYLTPPETTE